MAYNLTNLTSAETAADLVVFANEVTSGMFMMLFLFAIFFILLLALKRYGFAEALLASSFVIFLVSATLAYGSFVGIIWPLLFLAIMAFTGFYLYMQQ